MGRSFFAYIYIYSNACNAVIIPNCQIKNSVVFSNRYKNKCIQEESYPTTKNIVEISIKLC